MHSERKLRKFDGGLTHCRFPGLFISYSSCLAISFSGTILLSCAYIQSHPVPCKVDYKLDAPVIEKYNGMQGRGKKILCM